MVYYIKRLSVKELLKKKYFSMRLIILFFMIAGCSPPYNEIIFSNKSTQDLDSVHVYMNQHLLIRNSKLNNGDTFYNKFDGRYLAGHDVVFNVICFRKKDTLATGSLFSNDLGYVPLLTRIIIDQNFKLRFEDSR